MRKSVVIALALAIVICAIPAWSQGPGGPMGRGMGGSMMSSPLMAVAPPRAVMFERMATTLQLTTDQSAKLKDVTTKCDAAMLPLTTKLMDATRALRTAVTGTTYDVKTVKSLAAAAEKAEADCIAACIDEWTQIRSILTSDQAAQLQGMTMRPGPGGPGGRGGMAPGGMGPGGPPPAGAPAPPPAPGQ